MNFDLEKFRKSKNLTQVEFCKIIGIRQSNYIRFVNDTINGKTLNVQIAINIAKHFNISLNEIYGIVSPEERQQGIVDSLPVHINTLQSKLLDIFDEIGERLGENGQKAYIGIGESIIQNITK